MSIRDNRFLEPEKGDGVLGWAARRLVLWLVGGLAVYIFVNRVLLTPHDAAVQPSALTPVAAVPSRTSSPLVTNSLILRAARDGYVYADVAVDGSSIRLAFDTGASFVSLTQADAARAGIAGGLNYSLPIATGNGQVYAAPVTLREIRIGQLAIADVRAVVMPNLGMSVLGQSFLSRLDSYRMHDGVMTLTW